MFWFENKPRTAAERFPTVDVIQQNYKAKSTMYFIVYVGEGKHTSRRQGFFTVDIIWQNYKGNI